MLAGALHFLTFMPMQGRTSLAPAAGALEKSSPIPLYHQLERLLADRIAKGRYDQVLPGEFELVAEFGVSRGTVRQALQRLTQRGIILRRPGRGSFIAPPPLGPTNGSSYQFRLHMGELALPQSSQMLSARKVCTPRHIAQRLKIVPNSPSLRLVHLRFTAGRPLVLETSHLPEHVAHAALGPDLITVVTPRMRTAHPEDTVQALISDLLERSGQYVTRFTGEVKAVSLRAKDSKPLGLPPGAPAFALERLAWAGDQPAEHRLILAPADRVSLTTDWSS